MGQVLSAYGREGLEAIIIVTVLLARAEDRKSRQDVLTGAFTGFVLSTILVIVANDWADEHIFARVEGYASAAIGVVIAGILAYHAVKAHAKIQQVGFAVAFGLVSVETFEIGLQTLGVDLSSRLIGMFIAAAVLVLFFGTYRAVGRRPPTKQLQQLANVALAGTSIWLIVNSFDVLEEKNDPWFGWICLVVAVVLIFFSFLKGTLQKHTSKL